VTADDRDLALWLHTANAARRLVPEEVDLPCPTCDGRGWIPDRRLPLTRNERCPDCNGTRTGRAP
jgi:DnaJ-class molecular chaperone